ncbi:hypothetical protein Tco_0562662 [Tanacetum coccineum]
MNCVTQKKDYIQYPRFTKLIIADLMKKYETISPRIKEDYHSIKDDIPLVNVYTTGNVTMQGIVDIPMNQPQPVVSTQGTHMTTPSTHRKATLTAVSPQGKKRKQHAGETKKLDEDKIEKMVEGDKDEESYASEFADSMIKDDVDDFGTRIEPGSHKEHPKNVNGDDEEIEKEMKDDEIEKEEENDDVKKTDEVVKENDNDEGASGSMEFRNEKKQTPIPTPTRSPKTDLSSDKTIFEELTATVSPTTSTTSKDSSIPKSKKGFFYTRRRFFQEIQEVLDHCNNVIPEMTFAKTNEMINKDMPHLVNLAVNKDHEVDPINTQEMISTKFSTYGPKMIEELFRKHIQNTTLNLYPTTSSSTAGKSTVDL